MDNSIVKRKKGFHILIDDKNGAGPKPSIIITSN